MSMQPFPWHNVHALVFDFDGTLATCPYDFHAMRQAVLQVAVQYGLSIGQFTEQTGLLETIATGVRCLSHDTKQAEAFQQAALASLAAIEYEAAAVTVLIPGVVDALTKLRNAGYRLGVITRNSSAAVQRIIGSTRLPIEQLLCREDVLRPKPHPAHAEQMLALLNTKPQAALMVGDHPMDIEIGQVTGMGTVGVLTGQTDEETLRKANPDVILPSVIELSELLVAGDR